MEIIAAYCCCFYWCYSLASSHRPKKVPQYLACILAKNVISYFKQIKHSMQMEVISAVRQILSENAELISIVEKWN